MIAILAALQPEISACLGSLEIKRETTIAGFPAFETDGAILCQSGMAMRAQDATEAVIASVSPAAVLSVGIAGGLHAGVPGGQVVLCERIDHESHRESGVEQAVYSDPRLIEAAGAVAGGMGLPFLRGASLTIDAVAHGPEEKAHHHAWKAHDIVEMESYWVGAAAGRHGIPFLAVRTISDTATDTLHRTGAMGDDGTFDQERFLSYMREHPEAAADVARMAEVSRLAITNLAIMMAGLLPPLIQHFDRDVH